MANKAKEKKTAEIRAAKVNGAGAHNMKKGVAVDEI